MSTSPGASARLLSPEEIAVQAGQQIPFLRLPDSATVFAEREMRLRQLAAGHAMGDYLRFLAEVVHGQHALLNEAGAQAPVLPTPEQVEAAAQAGEAPLPASSWPRDASWRDGLAKLLDGLLPRLRGSPALAAVQALRAAPADELERQADRLLTGVMTGLDLGAAPLIAAALQLHWTRLVLATDAQRSRPGLDAFGRVDDATLCPCCASRPTASVTRIGAETSGYRYLHCSLCSTQWHMVRIKCAHCEGTKGIAYQSLEAQPGARLPTSPAAPGAVQVETCESCGHYLKIAHMEKDPHVEPVADDLASVTLDLLVSEAGRQRHGVNLLLLFGDPEPPPDPGGG